MKITNSQLKQIIKEELEKAMNEGVKDYIKHSSLHSSIPAGSLTKVLRANPELADKARNAADPRGQMEAYATIGDLLAQDVDIAGAMKRAGAKEIESVLNVKGFLRYAEKAMPQIWP